MVWIFLQKSEILWLSVMRPMLLPKVYTISFRQIVCLNIVIFLFIDARWILIFCSINDTLQYLIKSDRHYKSPFSPCLWTNIFSLKSRKCIPFWKGQTFWKSPCLDILQSWAWVQFFTSFKDSSNICRISENLINMHWLHKLWGQ